MRSERRSDLTEVGTNLQQSQSGLGTFSESPRAKSGALWLSHKLTRRLGGRGLLLCTEEEVHT